VWEQVKRLHVLKWFLVAFLFYSMGMQTVMLVAILFAKEVLGLPTDKLIVTAVIIQLVAIPGAVLMSRLSGIFGNLRVLAGVVVVWILICLSAYNIATLKEGGQN